MFFVLFGKIVILIFVEECILCFCNLKGSDIVCNIFCVIFFSLMKLVMLLIMSINLLLFNWEMVFLLFI